MLATEHMENLNLESRILGLQVTRWLQDEGHLTLINAIIDMLEQFKHTERRGTLLTTALTMWSAITDQEVCPTTIKHLAEFEEWVQLTCCHTGWEAFWFFDMVPEDISTEFAQCH